MSRAAVSSAIMAISLSRHRVTPYQGAPKKSDYSSHFEINKFLQSIPSEIYSTMADPTTCGTKFVACDEKRVEIVELFCYHVPFG
jgi:hypothetical protein